MHKVAGRRSTACPPRPAARLHCRPTPDRWREARAAARRRSWPRSDRWPQRQGRSHRAPHRRSPSRQQSKTRAPLASFRLRGRQERRCSFRPRGTMLDLTPDQEQPQNSKHHIHSHKAQQSKHAVSRRNDFRVALFGPHPPARAAVQARRSSIPPCSQYMEMARRASVSTASTARNIISRSTTTTERSPSPR